MEFKEITKKIINFGRNHYSYWGCALAGEVGEACNLIKKYERDATPIHNDEQLRLANKLLEQLAEELADVFIYTELTAQQFGIDLEAAIIKKVDKILLSRGEKL